MREALEAADSAFELEQEREREELVEREDSEDDDEEREEREDLEEEACTLLLRCLAALLDEPPSTGSVALERKHESG